MKIILTLAVMINGMKRVSIEANPLEKGINRNPEFKQRIHPKGNGRGS